MSVWTYGKPLDGVSAERLGNMELIVRLAMVWRLAGELDTSVCHIPHPSIFTVTF